MPVEIVELTKKDIDKLNLIEFDAFNNIKINNVSFMTNLQKNECQLWY